MSDRKSTLGWIGIAIGGISLILALVHFYAGPFSPQPTLEQTVAEKAVAIKNATVAALKGEEVEIEPTKPHYDADRIVAIIVPVLGGLAIILAVVGFASQESYRVAVGAAILGAGAIAFQFLTVALGMIVVAILVAAVIGSLGVG